MQSPHTFAVGAVGCVRWGPTKEDGCVAHSGFAASLLPLWRSRTLVQGVSLPTTRTVGLCHRLSSSASRPKTPDHCRVHCTTAPRTLTATPSIKVAVSTPGLSKAFELYKCPTGTVPKPCPGKLGAAAFRGEVTEGRVAERLPPMAPTQHAVTATAKPCDNGRLSLDIPVLIDGHTVNALVDTGADYSIMSSRLTRGLKKVTMPWWGPKIRTAGGQ